MKPHRVPLGSSGQGISECRQCRFAVVREMVESDELKNVRIRNSDLSGAQLRGVNVSNVSIDTWAGRISGLTINGVEVGPLVDGELDRRHPERLKLRPTSVAEVNAALDAVEAMWSPTIERAKRLAEARLHERVDGEYSFVETLRHLLFATDAWLTRMVLRVPNGYHEWGVPPDDRAPGRLGKFGLPLDAPPDDGPDLDAVLGVRADRTSRLRAFLSADTSADLTVSVTPPDPTGFPQGSRRIIDCFRLVFSEEWWHYQYAARDLAVLEAS